MFLVLVLCLIAVKSQDYTTPFTADEVATIRSYFTANIGDISGAYTGFLVAAPSKIDPNYYYHWMRDAGLSMNVLHTISVNGNTTNLGYDWTDKFKNYATWVTKVQSVSDPNNINVLGEAKFNPDGTVKKKHKKKHTYRKIAKLKKKNTKIKTNEMKKNRYFQVLGVVPKMTVLQHVVLL